MDVAKLGLDIVAPFAGAWIETLIRSAAKSVMTVAPFAGAWIETPHLGRRSPGGRMSLPSRERGLKHRSGAGVDYRGEVAPFAGAWIETAGLHTSDQWHAVAPFAGAWIETIAQRSTPVRSMSLPSRERGLKRAWSKYVS